jgi:peroxiredoxin
MRTLDTTLNAEKSACAPAKARRDRLTIAALTSLLVISVVLNVLLARRVHQFNSAQSVALAERVIKVGTSAPPITANRLGGGSETISYSVGDRPTVLYVFTPQCVWCTRNLDNLKTLIGKKRSDYRFIGISLTDDGVDKYVAEKGLGIPIYTGPSAEARAAYKLGSTPETIVVSPQGKVIQVWPGAYVGEFKSQVELYFRVTLPGITSESH